MSNWLLYSLRSKRHRNNDDKLWELSTMGSNTAKDWGYRSMAVFRGRDMFTSPALHSFNSDSRMAAWVEPCYILKSACSNNPVSKNTDGNSWPAWPSDVNIVGLVLVKGNGTFSVHVACAPRDWASERLIPERLWARWGPCSLQSWRSEAWRHQLQHRLTKAVLRHSEPGQGRETTQLHILMSKFKCLSSESETTV